MLNYVVRTGLFCLVTNVYFEHPTFQGVYAFGRKMQIHARLIHFFSQLVATFFVAKPHFFFWIAI